MIAKLISYSKEAFFQYDPEHYDDVASLIAYCAKVSNPSGQNDMTNANKLLAYLIKHKHWSPFEMASACIEITTTRDIARQILRHRSFSFQEYSQRYADPTKDLEFVTRQARLQDAKNRQNSIETSDVPLQAWWDAQQKFIIEHSKRIYSEAIDKGIAKEQARAVLPEGLTKTRLYMHGTIRSWIHYIDVRTTPGTQKEHMDIARECAYEINTVFPMIKDFVHDLG